MLKSLSQNRVGHCNRKCGARCQQRKGAKGTLVWLPNREGILVGRRCHVESVTEREKVKSSSHGPRALD